MIRHVYKAAMVAAGSVAVVGLVAGPAAAGHATTAELNSVHWEGNCTNYGHLGVVGSVSINALPSQAAYDYSLGVTLEQGTPDTTYNVWLSDVQGSSSCSWVGNAPVGQFTTDDNGVGQFSFGYDATAGQNYVLMALI